MDKKRSAPRRSRGSRARSSPPTPEQTRAGLEQIRRIIGVDAKPVGTVLPEAIAEATEQRSTALAVALEPSVSRALRSVATRDPRWFGEILSPSIGAAVRKAVRAALAALMQRFNEALDQSLSLRSFKWRLEARRTGRPFAEVVLLRTLVYRVEQVFLIHGETGLVLEHVALEGVPSTDPDQVASMLSAMDTFGKEAFEQGAATAHLHEFALGDLRVWIDRGPRIAVAVVVRGMAPRSLLELVAETRERIALEHQVDLASFVGDVAPFAATRPVLEGCLREQRAQPPRRGPVLVALAGVVVAALILAFPVRGYFHARQEEQDLSAVRSALDAEPGIVVTGAERGDNRYRLSGFRDPLAADPAAILTRAGHARAELDFEPFYSLEPKLVEERFRRLAQPPPGVVVAVSGGTLRISGRAPRPWIDRALPLASTLPGIEKVEAALSDATAGELASAQRALEALAVHFDPGSSELSPAADLVVERATRLIERVQRLAAELGRTACVVVIGDADASGSARLNARLARARAGNVLAAVRKANSTLAAEALVARPQGATDRGVHTRTARFQVRAAGGPPGSACGKVEGE